MTELNCDKTTADARIELPVYVYEESYPSGEETVEVRIRGLQGDETVVFPKHDRVFGGHNHSLAFVMVDNRNIETIGVYRGRPPLLVQKHHRDPHIFIEKSDDNTLDEVRQSLYNCVTVWECDDT